MDSEDISYMLEKADKYEFFGDLVIAGVLLIAAGGVLVLAGLGVWSLL